MDDLRKVLLVDLGARRSWIEHVDASGSFGLGGKVLGVRLLERFLDPGAAPFSAANVVAILPSRLSAYGMSGSNRFGAFTRSPLTGLWLESYAGGTFARTFTETGWDALVIVGASSNPVHLHVDQEGAHFRPADELWGKDTFAVEQRLLSELKPRSAVLCIGVAGENLVPVANVMHQQAHTLGRAGLGAVLGSKKLKAVSVTSTGPLRPALSERFVQVRNEVAKLAVDSPTASAYREFGTPVMVWICNEAGTFPTDFFSRGVAPHRRTLEAQQWHEWAVVEHGTCPPCPLRCRKSLTLTTGPQAGRRLHGPEYETIYAFGGSCMVEHARDVAVLSELCNRMGLDTISTGNLVAAAIKAKELGKLAEGPAAGDVEGIAQLVEAIATRSGSLGDLLSRGLDEALAELGMQEWSITSKRLDPAGYEPRRLKGMALSYAVSVRGACHLRATFYKAELAGLLDGLDDEAYVGTYIDWEDRMLIQDGLTLCRFYRATAISCLGSD